MSYGDEAIISQMLALREQKNHSIFSQNKLAIDGCFYTFARRSFVYGFTMIVPESFQPMPAEASKRKFPYEDRPKTILSSEDFVICLAFDSNPLPQENLDVRLHHYISCIKRLHPTTVFFSNDIIKLDNGLHVAYYDYSYPAIDGNIYAVSFFVDIADAEVFGWFTCPTEHKDAWNPLVHEMMKSIEPEITEGSK